MVCGSSCISDLEVSVSSLLCVFFLFFVGLGVSGGSTIDFGRYLSGGIWACKLFSSMLNPCNISALICLHVLGLTLSINLR